MAIQLELLLRIFLGTALGGVIGLERDLHGRPAGLRTHAIVALASATFMVVSTHFVFFQSYAAGGLIEVDASRIAASVVSGIGFLGAGAILRTGITVTGLTTAAALWLVAAIGMAAGCGMYAIAAFTTVVGLISLTMLRRFEDRGEHFVRLRLTVTLDEASAPIGTVVQALSQAGAKVAEEAYETEAEETKLTLDVRTPVKLQTHDLAETVRSVGAGVRQIRIERV